MDGILDPMPDPEDSTPAGGEEAQLVAQASGGDLKAFEALMTRYQHAVFKIALWKSKNYFDAEDLSQDIFLAAFKALGTIKTPGSFGGWLFGIAYNRCHKWFRRERTKVVKIQELRSRAEREESARQRPSAFGSLPEPGQTPGNGAGEVHLSESLSRLPREIRDCLTLKYLDGLSYEQIGARLGINAHRIDYLIRKGKQMIREKMKRPGEGDSP